MYGLHRPSVLLPTASNHHHHGQHPLPPTRSTSIPSRREKEKERNPETRLHR
ncbi:hypothetical protein FA13DRAFT_533104 [Coprinellus micaceus]|uniref:Uncharacterized protein n=1 Tax=Coprinellus micaceus TaxID=71717 RepID=A0A4Y7SBL4_COPMI|nr:hypothetical protein FA13DRAFT_533104 [Coprinellus micaceus]